MGNSGENKIKKKDFEVVLYKVGENRDKVVEILVDADVVGKDLDKKVPVTVLEVEEKDKNKAEDLAKKLCDAGAIAYTKSRYQLWGCHYRVQRANKQAEIVGPFPVRVLLQGDSGTGKSMLARHIFHYGGSEFNEYKTIKEEAWRKIHGEKLQEMLAWAAGKNKKNEDEPDVGSFKRGAPLENQTFREINLAALSETTICSELFGYVEGAYTDAFEHGSPGLFISANGGVLFLDEIADCPMTVQAKLLSVIQQRSEEDGPCACYVIPAGQEEEVQVNVRLVCATNKDLYKEVLAGRFRADLYYRLKEYEIELPSLASLGDDDLKMYINHVLEKTNEKLSEKGGKLTPKYVEKKLGEGVEDILLKHKFPGNYRELQSVIMQMCLNSRTTEMMRSGEDVDSIIDDREGRNVPGEIRASKNFDEETKKVRDVLKRDFSSNIDDQKKALKVLEEMIDVGFCTMADLAALCQIEGFKFSNPNVSDNGRGAKSTKEKANKILDVANLRNLCYFISLLKDGCSTKMECAVRLLSRSSSTLDSFLKKFCLNYVDAKKVINKLYGAND